MIKFYCTLCDSAVRNLDIKDNSYYCPKCGNIIFENKQIFEDYINYQDSFKKPIRKPKKFKESYGN